MTRRLAILVLAVLPILVRPARVVASDAPAARPYSLDNLWLWALAASGRDDITIAREGVPVDGRFLHHILDGVGKPHFSVEVDPMAQTVTLRPIGKASGEPHLTARWEDVFGPPSETAAEANWDAVDWPVHRRLLSTVLQQGDAIETKWRNHKLNEVQYVTKAGELRRVLRTRLKSRLSEPGDDALIREYLAYGLGRDRLLERLKTEMGNDRGEKLLADLEKFFGASHGRLGALTALVTATKRLSGGESQMPPHLGRFYGRLRKEIENALYDFLPGPEKKWLAYVFINNGWGASEIARRLADRFQGEEKPLIATLDALSTLSPGSPSGLLTKIEHGKDLDKRFWTGSLTAPSYDFQRRHNYAHLHDALRKSLPGPETSTLAYDFVYKGLRKEEVRERLSKWLEADLVDEVLESIGSLTTPFDRSLHSELNPESRTVRKTKERRPPYLDQSHLNLSTLVKALEELDEARRILAITKTQHSAERGRIKQNLARWLAIKLGATDEDRKRAQAFVYEDQEGGLVHTQLKMRLGEVDASEVWRNLEVLRKLLVPKALPLSGYVVLTKELAERKQQGLITDSVHSARKRHTRIGLTHWLERQLGGRDWFSIASAFMNGGLNQAAIAARLSQVHGATAAEEILGTLEELQAGLAPSVNHRKKDGSARSPFPFLFHQKNMVRDFVPEGYSAIALDDANKSAMLAAVRKATSEGDPDEILSLFASEADAPTSVTQSAAGASNIYFVFKDRIEPKKRGLARFSQGALKAVHVFQPLGPRRKAK